MPKFSKLSLERLATCHEDLRRVANHAIQFIDFTITCGERGKEAQDEAFAKGYSKLKFPKSKHNKSPSLAFDFICYPFDGDWKSKTLIPRLKAIGEQLKKSADELGVKVSYGGDWATFKDFPHLELAK